jgi:Caspase domain
MPINKQKPFSELVRAFKKDLHSKKKEKAPKIILVILADTLDKILSKDCKKDIKTITATFKKIAAHFNVAFCSIQVAGTHYKWNNVLDAVNAIKINNHSEFDSQIVFYYTGHGFSYPNEDKIAFPQLDLRPRYRKTGLTDIDFIRKNTINLEVIFCMLRIQGCRVNIAIADCCHTKVKFKRQVDSDDAMFGFPLPPKIKKLNKAIFTDDKNEIAILVGSSQLGEPAITDNGSIFTNFFAKAIDGLLQTYPKGEAYIPWVRILKQTAEQAFKESKGYDIGNGKPGNQKGIFQVYSDRYLNPQHEKE